MKFNKKIAKTLIFALALGFTPVLAVQAKAAENAAPSFDGAKGAVTVNAERKFWSFAKVAKNEKGANLKLNGGAELYSLTEINPIVANVIDLSSAKKNKEILLAVGKTKDIESGFYKEAEWKIVKIAPENAKFKVAYVSEAPKTNSEYAIPSKHGYITATDNGADYDLKTANKAKVEVRTDSSDWATLDKFFVKASAVDGTDKLEMLTQKGAKLYFRIAGTTTQDATVGTWPSKEASIKISAQDKAPKIAINNAKGEINFKKDMQFAVADDSNVPQAWKTAPGKVGFNDTKLGDNNPAIDGSKDVYLFAKAPAKGKKIESKIAMVKLVHQEKVTTVALESKDSGNIVATKADGVSFELKVPYDLKKGGILTNTSTTNYEVLLTKDDAPPAGAKWLSLKAKNKKEKPGKLNLKYTADNKLNTFGPASNIFVRLIGDKKIVNNEIKMYSAPSTKQKFIPAKVSQEISVTGFDSPVAYTVGTEKKVTGEVTFTNLFKDGLKLKLKMVKAPKGVKVKLDKLKKTDKNGKAKIELTVSKNAVKKAAEMTDKQVVFELSGEGAEVKKVTVTINPTDKQ